MSPRTLAVGFGLILALALAYTVPCCYAQGTTTSILDPSRLSVGARVYRSFDEKVGTAGSYSSEWWAGVPLAWELTSPHDPAVKFPISAIGSIDYGLPSKRIRGYIGIVFLLKRSGQ